MKTVNKAVFLALLSVMPAYAYHKVCYLRPQFGREGCMDDLKTIMGKHFVYNACKPVDYEVTSSDGRRTCHIRLSKTDMYRVRVFLEQCTDKNMLITDELVQQLMKTSEARLRSVGPVLRDFKYHNKDVTIQQVSCALGLVQK